MLDQIEEIGKKEDVTIDDIDQAAHVVNVDFEVQVTVNNPIVVNSEPKMTSESAPETLEANQTATMESSSEPASKLED